MEKESEYMAELEAELEADQTTPPYGHPSYLGGERVRAMRPITTSFESVLSVSARNCYSGFSDITSI